MSVDRENRPRCQQLAFLLRFIYSNTIIAAIIDTKDQKLPAGNGPIHGVVSLNKLRIKRFAP